MYDAFAEEGSDEELDSETVARGPSGQAEARGLLGRSRADQPYRDDVEDDEVDGDRRFALHDNEDDEEEEGDTAHGASSEKTTPASAAATGAIVDLGEEEEEERKSGGSGDGSWQDAAEEEGGGRDLIAGFGSQGRK